MNFFEYLGYLVWVVAVYFVVKSLLSPESDPFLFSELFNRLNELPFFNELIEKCKALFSEKELFPIRTE